MPRSPAKQWTLAVAVLFLGGGLAEAARLRLHYVAADDAGHVVLQSETQSGTVCNYRPRPTHLQTFRHPCTGRCVIVPLALPAGTPIIEHRAQRIIYNYGSYTVEIDFLPDGSVDVIYNSGLFRAL